jgi:hypothetical protein
MNLKKRIKKMIKKHNPPDSTPRNIRASQRRDDELTDGLKQLGDRVYKLEQRMEACEAMPQINPAPKKRKPRRKS